LWRGVYERRVPEYLLSEDENGNTIRVPIDEHTKNCINPEEFSSGGGNCDTDEVTHWQPYDEKHAETGWVPLPPMYVPPAMHTLRAHLLPPTPPPPPPTTDWHDDIGEVEVDPPAGWRYGFPKTWNKKTHPDLIAWLIENGYPENQARANPVLRFMAVSKEAT
jgi:hypothetical protein